MQVVASCFCLMSPVFALLMAVSAGFKAWKKGYSGTLFGVLFAIVCTSAFCAGMSAGIVIPLMMNPSTPKDEIGLAMITGSLIGGSFGVSLMGLVTRLLPDKFRPQDERESPLEFTL